jgi:hypothetical protein
MKFPEGGGTFPRETFWLRNQAARANDPIPKTKGRLEARLPAFRKFN